LTTATASRLTVFDSPEEARQAHRAGLLRLFMLQFREQLKYLEKNLPGLTQMAMQFMTLGTLDELRRQLLDLTVARACLLDSWPTDAAGFKARCAEARPRLGLLAQEICRLVGQILSDWLALQKKLPAFKAFGTTVQDVEGQLGRLIGKRFIIDTPFERLQHYPRYLKAIMLRLDKLKAGGSAGALRDARLLAELAPLWGNYQRRASVLARQGVQRRATRTISLAARRVARAVVRSGITHAGAGIEQAPAEDVGRHVNLYPRGPEETDHD
jgi:ATP-dependent helicase HrpA